MQFCCSWACFSLDVYFYRRLTSVRHLVQSKIIHVWVQWVCRVLFMFSLFVRIKWQELCCSSDRFNIVCLLTDLFVTKKNCNTFQLCSSSCVSIYRIFNIYLFNNLFQKQIETHKRQGEKMERKKMNVARASIARKRTNHLSSTGCYSTDFVYLVFLLLPISNRDKWWTKNLQLILYAQRIRRI